MCTCEAVSCSLCLCSLFELHVVREYPLSLRRRLRQRCGGDRNENPEYANLFLGMELVFSGNHKDNKCRYITNRTKYNLLKHVLKQFAYLSNYMKRIENIKLPFSYERKEEIWLSHLTKAPRTTENSKNQRENTKTPPKLWLHSVCGPTWTVSLSNNNHPSGVDFLFALVLEWHSTYLMTSCNIVPYIRPR